MVPDHGDLSPSLAHVVRGARHDVRTRSQQVQRGSRRNRIQKRLAQIGEVEIGRKWSSARCRAARSRPSPSLSTNMRRRTTLLNSALHTLSIDMLGKHTPVVERRSRRSSRTSTACASVQRGRRTWSTSTGSSCGPVSARKVDSSMLMVARHGNSARFALRASGPRLCHKPCRLPRSLCVYGPNRPIGVVLW